MTKYKLTKLNNVEASKEAFLWYPYLPQNATTLLTGTGGTGKSFFALDSACKMILNKPLGNGLNGSLNGRGVAYISTEETAENSVNRIKALFNDKDSKKIMEKIMFVSKDDLKGQDGTILNLSDGADREDFFSQLYEANIGLVIFDPLTSFVGQNRNNANGIRMAFEGLNQALQKYNITAIGIGHLNKPTGKSTEFRVMGSTEWISCVRSSLMMAVDVKEPSITYIAINKGNNVPEEAKARYLAYSKAIQNGNGLEFNDDLVSEEFDFSDHVKGKQPKSFKWQQASSLILQILGDDKFKDGIKIGSRKAKKNGLKTLFGQFEARNRADLKRQGEKALSDLDERGVVERFIVEVPLTKAQLKKSGHKNFKTRSEMRVRIVEGKRTSLIQLELERILENKEKERKDILDKLLG
tara:strand:- start:10998 stop:12230 length:1233 start_codon:yes stop_codon:yes gene_type:complete